MGRKGTRVLSKRPPGKEVAPGDTFLWNKSFTSDRVKFRINQIQQDMSAEESKKTNEQVAVDRVSVLEATIVRIMKARKKPIETLKPADLGVDATPRLTVLKVEEPPKRQAGRKVASVAELVDKLRNEAKVI